MARVRLRDGREFDIMSVFELTLGEAMELEQLTGYPMEAWSATAESTAMTYISARAAGVPLSWEELTSFRPGQGDLERIAGPDDPDPDADPLAPDAGRSPHPPDAGDRADHGSTPSSSPTSPSDSG
jgi:hypothetical protein